MGSAEKFTGKFGSLVYLESCREFLGVQRSSKDFLGVLDSSEDSEEIWGLLRSF